MDVDQPPGAQSSMDKIREWIYRQTEGSVIVRGGNLGSKLNLLSILTITSVYKMYKRLRKNMISYLKATI